jgi:hypothetical protein
VKKLDGNDDGAGDGDDDGASDDAAPTIEKEYNYFDVDGVRPPEFAQEGLGSMDYLARKNAHPRDEHIQFFEEGHRYVVYGESGKYTSVTTWNHSMFGHFDADKAVRTVMKNRRYKKDPTYKYYLKTPEEMKQMWEDNRDAAASAGTQMHLNIEQFYNGLTVKNSSKEFLFFLEFWRDFVDVFEPYRTEWCVFHEELRLSGSIDMVYRHRLTGDFYIYDWKRTPEIVWTSKFEEVYSHVPCLSDIPDTNFWHYSLQLNTYRYILETKYGLHIAGMCLIVLHPDNPQGTYDRVEVHDLRDRMGDIWKYRAEVLAMEDAVATAAAAVAMEVDEADEDSQNDS